MSLPQAIVHWPGVQQFDSANVELAHGISPGTSTITIPPQMQGVADSGTLTVQYGNQRITLPDCKLDASSLSYDKQGALVSLSIMDRRWRWQYGHISGVYNRRDDDGTLDIGTGAKADDTERTPQELAKLLLDAMGEKGYDVKALPNEARPFVEWRAANPAQELAKLCDDLGCHVTLELRTSKVKIVRVGKGAALPNGPVTTDNVEVNLPEKPDAFVVVCGPSVYQADLELEAVTEEADGTVVKLNEASYAPPGGFESLGDTQDYTYYDDRAKREIAKRCVYRMYRPVVPFDLPGFGWVTSLSQIVSLRDRQVQKATLVDRNRGKPAVVYGKYVPYTGLPKNTVEKVTPLSDDSLDVQRLWVPFSIDAKRKLIIFNDMVVADVGGTWLGAATLRLRTSLTVCKRETREVSCHTRRRATPGAKYKTKDKPLLHEEVVASYYPEYKPNFDVAKTIDNLEDVNKECDSYLDAAISEIEIQQKASRTYAGIVPIELDGAIQSVSFRISSQGAFTSAHRNHDPGSPVNLPYQVKRQRERDRRARELQGVFGAEARAVREAGI